MDGCMQIWSAGKGPQEAQRCGLQRRQGRHPQDNLPGPGACGLVGGRQWQEQRSTTSTHTHTHTHTPHTHTHTHTALGSPTCHIHIHTHTHTHTHTYTLCVVCVCVCVCVWCVWCVARRDRKIAAIRLGYQKKRFSVLQNKFTN